jgi:exonuclease VII small subunit
MMEMNVIVYTALVVLVLMQLAALALIYGLRKPPQVITDGLRESSEKIATLSDKIEKFGNLINEIKGFVDKTHLVLANDFSNIDQQLKGFADDTREDTEKLRELFDLKITRLFSGQVEFKEEIVRSLNEIKESQEKKIDKLIGKVELSFNNILKLIAEGRGEAANEQKNHVQSINHTISSLTNSISDEFRKAREEAAESNRILTENAMASFEKAIALTKQGQEALNQAVKMLQKEVSDALSAITKTNSEMTAAVDKAGEMLSERFAGFSKDALNKLEGIKQEIMIQIMKNQGDRLDLFEEKLSKRLEESIIKLTSDVDGHLKEISGKVAERLDDGFKKTNETFTNVMARLATIDEAQKKSTASPPM